MAEPTKIRIERERLGLSTCAAHRGGQEGLKAFSEKQKPVFNRKQIFPDWID